MDKAKQYLRKDFIYYSDNLGNHSYYEVSVDRMMKALEIAYLEGQVAVETHSDDINKWERLNKLTNIEWETG